MAVRRLQGGDPNVLGLVDALAEKLVAGFTWKASDGKTLTVKNVLKRGQDLLVMVEVEGGGIDQFRITSSHY